MTLLPNCAKELQKEFLLIQGNVSRFKINLIDVTCTAKRQQAILKRIWPEQGFGKIPFSMEGYAEPPA